MRLTFLGAAGEVTGSAFLLETDRARLLVDFGMHQGETDAEDHNKLPPGLDAARIQCVVLTHAHIDHCGRLPMLPPAGFTGPIHCTPATMELADILLNDTAALQEADAERENRMRAGSGLPPVTPLYGKAEVAAVMKRFRGLPYTEPREVAPGVTARMFEAGHILGAASVELRVNEGGREVVMVFSGDIGPKGLPLLRDPTLFKRADVALMESTYGDRDHRSRTETVAEFDAIVQAARKGPGKILIPAFAVGRTQDMIYEMAKLSRAGRFDGTQVFIDSPMATDVTELYRRHRELFDTDARQILADGNFPLNFPGLRFTRTVEESKKLNDLNGIIVIAGSGMCNGGRIVHHLRHGLSRPENHVVIVGYQAIGTLGRRLVDGQKVVRIMGDEVPVRAQIHTLGGFSAHAGQSELVTWAKSFDPKPAKFFLTHGEPKARNALWERLNREVGLSCERPEIGQTFEL